jgi:malate dehydrogenase
MNKKQAKVSIIGSGNVGANAALFTAISGVADIVLVDVAEGLAAGKALDISQALAILGIDTKIEGHNHYDVTADSQVVVITAGLARQPGMSRSDLLHKNAAIMKSVVRQVKKYSPEAIIIVVTNPLDVMTFLAFKETGFPSSRVMGMGGLLDSGRFVHFLAEAANVNRSAIEALVIGSHGDEMVPLSRLATAGGKVFEQLLGQEALSAVAEKTRGGGAQIVGLLKTGSAAYGPGAAISMMIKSIVNDEKRVFSVCSLATGEYGQNDIYLNLPTVIGASGVEGIIEMNINEAERDALAASASSVRAMLAELGESEERGEP